VFYQAAVLWKHLKHPNILPLLGVTVSPPRHILDWVSDGTLDKYITENPNVDRLKLVGDPPIVVVPRLLQPLAIRRRKGPLLPPLAQCDPWGSQGGT
jgi:hypothetical protein